MAAISQDLCFIILYVFRAALRQNILLVWYNDIRPKDQKQGQAVYFLFILSVLRTEVRTCILFFIIFVE